MTRTGKVIAALAAVAVTFEAGAHASHGIPGAGGTVFVTERQLGSVAAFDAASGEMLWTAGVGAAPIGVVQPRGTDKVYTSDEGPDQMTVLDRRTGAWLATIPMGPDPHHLNASRNGEFIYVAEFGRNTARGRLRLQSGGGAGRSRRDRAKGLLEQQLLRRDGRERGRCPQGPYKVRPNVTERKTDISVRTTTRVGQ